VGGPTRSANGRVGGKGIRWGQGGRERLSRPTDFANSPAHLEESKFVSPILF
jgi:hypothetical protein